MGIPDAGLPERGFTDLTAAGGGNLVPGAAAGACSPARTSAVQQAVRARGEQSASGRSAVSLGNSLSREIRLFGALYVALLTMMVMGVSSSASSAVSGSSHRLATAAAVLRRQQFLVRSLRGGGLQEQTSAEGMAAEARSGGLEADAVSILRRITPPFDSARHKGQAGNIAVIGGCREYTGAPYFAAITALKIGADLSHVFCTKDAAPVIKSYSPELIVHPVLEESYSIRDDEKVAVSRKVLSEVIKWMARFDCLVIGPGLGRDQFLLDCVSEIMKHARQSNIPIIIDGDGLFLVTNNLDLVKGYSLAVLTPNVNEYKRLVEKVFGRVVDDQNAPEELLSLSRGIGGATILRKGKADLISDGERVSMVSIFGSPRRCGGQGDILSGSVAVFSSWARHQMSENIEELNFSSSNPMVLGSIAGSALLRKAAALAFAYKKRATLTTDIIEFLGTSLEDMCPAN